FGPPPAGELRVDDGAAQAILQRGSSLLPSGVVSGGGTFSRGEVLRVRAPNGKEIARGMIRYNSDALSLIAGRQSQEIADILGYEYGRVVIQRDDLILI
ncbi:glutamate 5-kinase, partial [Plesiomonas shigelloides]